jgi:thymidylate synthase (FAD)
MSEQQPPATTEIKVLHDGFVRYVNHMGSDADIAASARLSYGKDTPPKSDDRTLLRYLMRHRHTSPFEMAEIKFFVRVPIDIWRQWVRHRTASINEYSTRYSEAIDAVHVPSPSEWRRQSTSNKQGSEDGEMTDSWIHSLDYRDAAIVARESYERAIKCGISREQARGILPLSTYTEAVWKIDLHNLMHFLSLRLDSHAQQEIREYAEAISDIVDQLFPESMAAFYCYRLNAMTLTGLDIEAIQQRDWTGQQTFSNDRERREFVAKIERLKIGSGQ